MKLGFLTACLPQLPLEEIAAWGAGHGYEALEVATWPSTGSRDFEASHIDVLGLTEQRADEVRTLFDKHGLTLSALAYYENNLHPDEARRSEIAAHVRANVDAARLLGVDYVGTFIGRHTGLSVKENLALAARELPPLVEYAGERGVRIIIENCVMEGWHPDGYPGNLAYSPELWEWMFDLGFYLNYDPSHLLWLGIDPVAALKPYVDRIPHAQAKDAQLDPRARDRYGSFGRAVAREDGWDSGWWRYRVPGLGDVDWRRIVDTLYEGGFTGTLSVEHEDPVWSGDVRRVTQGLEIAHRTLRPLIVG
ncbi:sugar phosphate isomerase/epimerase family protein [Actinacidiphila sp. ITFR-21]|uniref:sugar phosphate isomerase/epimerase family protein n=1 Tax=Actinacidiphila sp. ITFR-21 TaxID=3075199 RepID=UPI002889BB7C|nr:sugar phosphate isomerase/epimerase [Streptomyces sp. ITFR-21]WNI14560.1 sugar phosphate isomerase/epimerase [Streptomyces sp. ITFR-21]